jgi:Cdc6-like AAA superfamily ATPase
MSEKPEENECLHKECRLLAQVPSPRSSDGDGVYGSLPVSCVPLIPPSSKPTTDGPHLKHENLKDKESEVVIEKDLSSVGIWKVQDDDDSSSHTSTSSSQDPTAEMPMTLTERRAFNIQRNNALLARLGMMNIKNSSPSKSATHRTDELSDSGNSQEPMKTTSRGMIVPTCLANMERQRRQSSRKTLPTSLKELYDRYPHRSAQIRKIFSLLSVPHMATMATSRASVAPPPIFVIGPAGSGKTMIVRDVVQLLCCMDYDSFQSTTVSSIFDLPELRLHSTKPNRTVLNAYVDCATLDSFNMEELFSSAFSQWRAQIATVASVEDNRKQHPQKCQPSVTKVTSSTGTAQPKSYQSQGNNYKNKRKGRAKSASRKFSSNLDENLLNLNSSTDPASQGQILGAQNITLTGVWTFGRSLQYLLGKLERDGLSCVSIVLILDHAEMLLSLGSSHTKTLGGDRINVLAQLLMLPQVCGFDFTIISISKNTLLEHTGTLVHLILSLFYLPRLNAMSYCSVLNNMKSQGSIGIHLCPMSVYFPAYRGKAAIQTVC